MAYPLFCRERLSGYRTLWNLVADSAETSTATTSQGGKFTHGDVYEMVRPVPPKTAWTQITLYSFSGSIDGGSPLRGWSLTSRAIFMGRP